MMRIITGRARGTKLATLEGDSTRPTSERAKEAIFSSIQFELADREVLDLFAGSGQMGLEALSRGAAHATFVEKNKNAARIIEQNISKAHMEDCSTLVCSDAFELLRTQKNCKKYDLLFLDPPYAQISPAELIMRVYSANILRTGALCVIESGEELVLEAHELKSVFCLVKKAKHGIAYITILKLLEEEK